MRNIIAKLLLLLLVINLLSHSKWTAKHTRNNYESDDRVNIVIKENDDLRVNCENKSRPFVKLHLQLRSIVKNNEQVNTTILTHATKDISNILHHFYSKYISFGLV